VLENIYQFFSLRYQRIHWIDVVLLAGSGLSLQHSIRKASKATFSRPQATSPRFLRSNSLLLPDNQVR
jgi:hypothetical protein